jgi:hypothetical protein
LRTAPCSVLVVKMPRRVADVKPDIELAGVRA